ncbi:hypothetical protein AAHC03_04529 [Spirometra sp. Aus1]
MSRLIQRTQHVIVTAKTRKAWEFRLTQNKARDEEIRKFETFRREHNNLVAKVQAEELAQQRRREAILKNDTPSNPRAEAIDAVERTRMLNTKTADVDGRLARALQNREQEDARDLALRKMVRQNSHELRQLESKLRSAYVAKENRAQMAEKRALKYNEMVNDVRYGCYLNQVAQEEEAADKIKAQETQKKREELQADMRQQAETRERRRLEAYEEFMRDKMLIDEVVRKIHEEDQLEAERRLISRREHKALIEEFKACQETWKRAEDERIRAENERVARYLAEQENRVKESATGREERQRRLEEVQANLAKIIQQKEEERMEMENLSQLLAQEKENEKAARSEAAELEEKLRRRLLLHKEHELYMARRAKECEIAKEEEERYRAALLAKFAEDDRLEQLSNEKRRLRMLEHRREAQRMVEEKRKRLEEQKRQEQAEALAQCEREDYRRKIIEEERIRLLQEHAGSLLGYLPRGIIRDEKEFEALDDKVKSAIRAPPGPAASSTDAESTADDFAAPHAGDYTFDYRDLRSQLNTPAARRPF